MRDLADEKEVKEAETNEKLRRERELNDIKTVLSSISGRRLLWRLLEHCRTFSSVFSESSSSMAYNSGQQDVGHFIMAEIVNADESLLLRLMKENKKKE